MLRTTASIRRIQRMLPVHCVPSIADDGTDTDVTVTVNLHNPKNFRLVTPAASPADAGKVIRFPGLSPQPTYGTDYTLTPVQRLRWEAAR